MIFQRALRRELDAAAGAVLTTLFTITITVMLIKILLLLCRSAIIDSP
jgi:lipopolysaccharide export system permease protein